MRKYRKRQDPLLFGYESPVLNKMLGMWYGAESRAKSYGREFNISLDDVIERYVEICPILGIPIEWNNTGTFCHGSPSLDRVDNTKGYIKGNIQIISHRANALKKDYLLCEWEKVCAYMQQCGDEPFQITEEHFIEPMVLSEREKRDIRVGNRNGMSIAHIAAECDLPLEQVVRYYNEIQQKIS